MTVKPARILNVWRQTNGCPLSNYKAYDRHCRILFINSNNVQGGHKCLLVLIHREDIINVGRLHFCNYPGPTQSLTLCWFTHLFKWLSKGHLTGNITIWNGLSQQASKWSSHKTPQLGKQVPLMISHKANDIFVNGPQSHMACFICYWLWVVMWWMVTVGYFLLIY